LRIKSISSYQYRYVSLVNFVATALKICVQTYMKFTNSQNGRKARGLSSRAGYRPDQAAFRPAQAMMLRLIKK